MSKGKHREAEMIGALKQMEAGGPAADVAKKIGSSSQERRDATNAKGPPLQDHG